MNHFNIINSFYAKCGYCNTHCKSEYNEGFCFICRNHGNIVVHQSGLKLKLSNLSFSIMEKPLIQIVKRHIDVDIETVLYEKNRKISEFKGAFPINPDNFEYYVKKFKSLIAFS